MKLLNYTTLYLSVALFVALGLWSVLFYFQLLGNIKTTIDEGLANNKILIIDHLKDDPAISTQESFGDKNYIIRNISEDEALKIRDTYKDTLIFSSLTSIYKRARLLTTAFVAENGQYYKMKVISQELDRGKLIQQLATSMLWLFLILLLSLILINNLVLKKTWTPFYQLLNYLRDFSLEKEPSPPPSKTRIKEFSILNHTVLKLLKMNANTYKSQKQFIENASHELQTPLSISINKLELLAGSANLTNEHIQKIENVIQILQRLSGLNKSLLLISKIENKQFAPWETINFNTIFNQIIDDFHDYTEYRKIKVLFTKKDNCQIKMNKNLAEILVLNLVKNAIFHNYEGGEVYIELSANQFSIENTSYEPALQSDKLFERFNKNPNKKGSTGLGLAIVKTIADVSGLTVIYSYTSEQRHLLKVSSEFRELK
jgi:signal transduction histidine kinase